MASIINLPVEAVLERLQRNGKKKKKDFSSWEFFGFCECKRSETDAGGIITYCKLFVSDKEGKKPIVYSLTFAKLSRDKVVVK